MVSETMQARYDSLQQTYAVWHWSGIIPTRKEIETPTEKGWPFNQHAFKSLVFVVMTYPCSKSKPVIPTKASTKELSSEETQDER